ncbi:MAG TPA: hypothetical protein VL132_16875 [Planctomycetaceae bacterium]|nr:hypothetical protein [Planctomycetaceae bacterium]
MSFPRGAGRAAQVLAGLFPVEHDRVLLPRGLRDAVARDPAGAVRRIGGLRSLEAA